MRELLQYISTRTNVALFLVGTMFLLLGVYFAPQVPGQQVSLTARAIRLFEPIGYSILVTTLVAAVLNYSFQASIQRQFTIIKGVEGGQIQRVFANRRAALREIGPDVQRVASRIDLLCVAGTDVLQPNTVLLDEIGRRCDARSSVTVRVLLLDPRSRYAVERCLREENETIDSSGSQFDYPNKKLCEDTLLALRQLEKVLEDRAGHNSSNFSLTVRLANCAPMMLFLRLDDRTLVEQYHLGLPPSQVGTRFTRCLGKSVPVMEVSGDSQLARVLDSHFTYLWDRAAGRQVYVGATKALLSSLSGRDWLADYRDHEKREDALLDFQTFRGGISTKGAEAV